MSSNGRSLQLRHHIRSTWRIRLLQASSHKEEIINKRACNFPKTFRLFEVVITLLLKPIVFVCFFQRETHTHASGCDRRFLFRRAGREGKLVKITEKCSIPPTPGSLFPSFPLPFPPSISLPSSAPLSVSPSCLPFPSLALNQSSLFTSRGRPFRDPLGTRT